MKMKKVLFPILAVVLALSLALPMAAVAGAQPVYIETLYLSNTLGASDGYSQLYTVVLDDVTPKADLIPLPDVGWGAGIIPLNHADAIATTPDGTKIYAIDDPNSSTGPREIGVYDLTVPSWTSLGNVKEDNGTTDFRTTDQLAFAQDGTLYVTRNEDDKLYTIDIDSLSGTYLRVSEVGQVQVGGNAVNISGADIVFDADDLCWLFTGGSVGGNPAGLYKFSQSTGPTTASLVGANSQAFTGMAIRGGGTGDLIGSITKSNNDSDYDSIAVISKSDGSTGTNYPMFLDGSRYTDYIYGDMTVGELEVEEEPEIIVEKDYRYTNVAFERDNDGDGFFSEDPTVDQIDEDNDGLDGEDPIDYPGGTSLGDLLPMDNGNYQLEAVIHPKNDKVKSYNPGQYYAVSTVTVLDDVDTLTIFEDWSACNEISVLNPKNGGGRVVIVQVGGEINGLPVPDPLAAYQILDADSDEVTVDNDNHTATAVLEDVKAGTTILMYVKFGPGLKGEPWNPPNGYYGPCENINMASTLANPDTQEPGDWIEASANLILVAKE